MAEGPIAALLGARSVAIIGASDDPERIGGRPVRYLRAAGYDGDILPVNPNRATVQGLPAYPSVDALPGVPDVAIIAVGRTAVPDAVAACAERGIGTAIVYASGFAEMGPDGLAAQESLALQARAAGIRLLGPNCNGTIGVSARTTFAFTPVMADGLPRAGGLAIATQSAAIGTYWLRRCRERQEGMHAFVHTGNEADITLAEVLVHLLGDPGVDVVLCALEQWRDPAAMDGVLAALARSSASLVVLPVGRTEVGRQAAASHTGGLAARHTMVASGLLRGAGAHVVGGMEEALLVASALALRPARGGRRAGILTPSGGLGVLLADALSSAGFSIPPMREALQARWTEAVPFCSPRNPVDVTAQLVNEPHRYELFVSDLIGCGDIDTLVAFVPHASREDALTCALVGGAEEARSRGIVVAAVGSVDRETAAWLGASGIIVLRDPTEAATVLGRVVGGPPHGIGESAAALGIPSHTEPLDLDAVRPDPGAATTDERRAKTALGRLGVPVVADVVVRTPEEAAGAAAELGYPVVLKALVAGLAHKARAGGVVLSLRDADAVLGASADLLDRFPGGSLLVEPQIAGDELFLAARRDPAWGPLVMLGLGGVGVEAEAQVAVRRAPVDEAIVADMIAEVPALAALMALGGRSRAVAVLAAVAERLAGLAALDGVVSVELNPVMLQPGGDCVVVDALIEWQTGWGPATAR